jgi:hypothetical protein
MKKKYKHKYIKPKKTPIKVEKVMQFPQSKKDTIKPRFRYKLTMTFLITLISLIASYFTVVSFFTPKITVDTPQITDSLNPYSASFKVQNQSSYILNDLTYFINVKGFYLRNSQEGYIDVIPDNSKWLEYSVLDEDHNKTISLEPQESDSPHCNLFKETLPELRKNGQIMGIQITYKLSFWPFRFKNNYLFKLKYHSQSIVEWIPIANNLQMPDEK